MTYPAWVLELPDPVTPEQVAALHASWKGDKLGDLVIIPKGAILRSTAPTAYFEPLEDLTVEGPDPWATFGPVFGAFLVGALTATLAFLTALSGVQP